MSDQQGTLKIRAVLYQDGEWWCAHCLEFDVATQTKNLTDLPRELLRVLVSHYVIAEELKQKPFDGIGQAPQRYQRLFDGAKLKIEADVSDAIAPLPDLPSIQMTLRVAEVEHV